MLRAVISHNLGPCCWSTAFKDQRRGCREAGILTRQYVTNEINSKQVWRARMRGS